MISIGGLVLHHINPSPLTIKRMVHNTNWLYPGLPTSNNWMLPLHEVISRHSLSPRQSESNVLKLHNNMYRKNQAGRVRNERLHIGLTKTGFGKSTTDECVYKNMISSSWYVDDSIIISKTDSAIDGIIIEPNKLYKLTNKEQIEDYLGIHVEHLLPYSTIKLPQPHLIDQILRNLQLPPKARRHQTPAVLSHILQRCKYVLAFQGHFHYWSIVKNWAFLKKYHNPT